MTRILPPLVVAVLLGACDSQDPAAAKPGRARAPDQPRHLRAELHPTRPRRRARPAGRAGRVSRTNGR